MNPTNEEMQILNESIANYEFINKDGRLVLEDFCVALATYMRYDNSGYDENATAGNFHQLFYEVMQQNLSAKEIKQYIKTQRLVDWTPNLAIYYPDKERTLVHVSCLVLHGSEWISQIGWSLMDIPEHEWQRGYFGWANEEWHYTHSFLSAYHHALFSFMKSVDLIGAESGKVSNFEVLNLTKSSNIEYEAAESSLHNRNMGWIKVASRISEARDAGFHLEAISLAENLISHILYNFIVSKSKGSEDMSFHNLIKATRLLKMHDTSFLENLERLDNWRKARNSSIHKFVQSSINDIASSQDTLSETSEKTSAEGAALVKIILQWYRAEAVNFIGHNFSRKRLDS